MSMSRPVTTAKIQTSIAYEESCQQKKNERFDTKTRKPETSESLGADRRKKIREFLFQVAGTPHSQLQEKHQVGKTSRIELLGQTATKLGFNFAAVPIGQTYGTIGQVGILAQHQTKLKLDIPREFIDFSETFNREEARSANEMLTSGVKGQHYLSALKTPAIISIDATEKTEGTLWPEDVAANSVNVLLLAGKFMSDVVFFDPKKLEGQNFLQQSMTLTCEFHEFENLLQKEVINMPLWVTSDESHVYIFQDKTRTKNELGQHREAIKRLIKNGVKPAFSDIVGHGPSFTSSVAIKQAEGDSVLRLIPTLSGITIQAISRGDVLYSQPKYLLFLYSIAKQLCDNAFGAKPTSDSKLSDDFRASELMCVGGGGHKLSGARARATMFGESSGIVFSTSSAHSSRNLIENVQILENAGCHEWLYSTSEVKQFAVNGKLSGDQTKRQINIKLQQIQKEFKQQRNDYIKNAMEITLADIPYSKYLRRLKGSDPQINQWVAKLQDLNGQSVSARSQLSPEMARNCRLAIAALSKLSSSEDMQSKHIQMVAACVIDITKSLDMGHFTQQDKITMLQPLLTVIKKLQINPEDDVVKSTELYETVIDGLTQCNSKEHKPWMRPESVDGIEKWLTDYGNLGCFTHEQQRVFQKNHEAIFNILGKKPQDLNTCLHANLQLVKNNMSDQYSITEIQHFEATLRDWAIGVRHKKIVDKETKARFMNFIPVIQELMLGRLWFTSESMNRNLATSFNALVAPDQQRSITHGRAPSTSQELVISTSQFSELKKSLQVKITTRGELSIVTGRRCEKLQPERLCRLNRGDSERPVMLIIKDCLTQNSHEFDSTWGKNTPVEKKLRSRAQGTTPASDKSPLNLITSTTQWSRTRRPHI
ncbi:MAG: hypothetical protein HAW66_07670 [Shewanella sp.]|nr:hypothetical protein [Shewanella sp.]